MDYVHVHTDVMLRCPEGFNQFIPQEPPQHPPDSQAGPVEYVDPPGEDPMDIIETDISFLCSLEPHEGHTTSSITSFPL
jgi:hypothetical protein